MQVQLTAKSEESMTGISRYTSDLWVGLQAIGLNTRLSFPNEVPIPRFIQRTLKHADLDVRAFFANYPFRVSIDHADIYHLTGQMLATLLLFQRFPGPVIVSVLDIIPYLVRSRPELNTLRHPIDRLFYRMALHGLRQADALIAISEYTKATLVDTLGLPVERIHVVYPIVDDEHFRPQAVSASFRTRYEVDAQSRYVLFVGSEDPRKNLCTLLQAFARIKQQISNVKLLKVGASQFTEERKKLLALIAQLGIQQDVQFFDYVPEEDLPSFYNAADIFAMPSLYEGFGLPLVEAMCCGTPVVYANAGALPEVVDGGGLQVGSRDPSTFADALVTLLTNPDVSAR